MFGVPAKPPGPNDLEVALCHMRRMSKLISILSEAEDEDITVIEYIAQKLVERTDASNPKEVELSMSDLGPDDDPSPYDPNQVYRRRY